MVGFPNSGGAGPQCHSGQDEKNPQIPRVMGWKGTGQLVPHLVPQPLPLPLDQGGFPSGTASLGAPEEAQPTGPSSDTMVSLGPACSPVVALAGAGDPSIALEPSLDKQESKGCLMGKVRGGKHSSPSDD